MKKLIILCSFVVLFIFSSMNIFTVDAADEQSSVTKISVTFKVGSAEYTVNNKVIKAEASVLTKEIIFVPLNVITDALNAGLKVDLKTKTAMIEYNDVKIQLTEKKNEAVIDGKTVKIDGAPYIKNSSFMVSLSFLADTLGADITKDNNQISFIKEIVNLNSIKDYSSLIKKTKREKIGDSYYKWSMALPNNLKLDDRNFNGRSNFFAAGDGSYYFSVYIAEKTENETIDDLVDIMIDYTKGYTLIDYGVSTDSDGIEYVEFIYKDDQFIYQNRMYLTKDKKFDITLFVTNENSYEEEKYQNFINSFRLKFSKDGSIEDLSDVSSSGYRKYQDTRLKWSINLHPDFAEFKDEKINNKVGFGGNNEAYFSVEMYSLEKGETLDSITENSVKKDTEELNADLFKITKQEKMSINGADCNKVYYSLELPKGTIYGCDAFFVNQSYKYIIRWEFSEKDYNTNRQKKFVEGMLNSFKFAELDEKKIGKLLDPGKVAVSNKTRTISEDAYSFVLPASWKAVEGNDATYKKYYKDTASMTVYVTTDLSFSEYISLIETQVQKNVANHGTVIDENAYVMDKGTSCKKYVLRYTRDGQEFREESYILQRGNKVFTVIFEINNLRYGIKNAEVFNEIWKSFTLK